MFAPALAAAGARCFPGTRTCYRGKRLSLCPTAAHRFMLPCKKLRRHRWHVACIVVRMNRDDLQALTRARLKDARALLRAKRYDAAYYVAGYAIECALKACIAKMTKEFDFPDRDVVVRSYTHKLHDLVRVAGLEKELDARKAGDSSFAKQWTHVADWHEQSRYDCGTTYSEVKRLYFAITSRQHGVLTWLKKCW